MCRLFAALSTRSLPAAYFLIQAPQSLLVQSHIQKKRLQGDGWGVGWFEQGRPRIRKSPSAIYEDRALLQRVARQAQGATLLGHVRWASNPLKLPKDQIIGLVHTQPFVHGRWIFAHNGTLLIPKETQDALGDWAKFVQGKNDSEVLFYWLMKHLEPLLSGPSSSWTAESLAAGLRKSLTALDGVWQKCRKRYPLYRFPYHGLNCLLTNGDVLIAFCLVNPDGFGPTKALCRPKQPYYQLQRLETPEGIVVASEPLDPKMDWKPFAHSELLLANRTPKIIQTQTALIFP